MLEKTFASLEATFKVLEKEMTSFFKSYKGLKTGTKIKIKKGSIVTINGATAKLLDDVVVLTNKPDTLMGKS
jgi:hypothetical protein